jgi:hypothetical protein
VTNSSLQDPNQQNDVEQEDSPLSEAFIACLESEANVLQEAIEGGTTPMQAQAKTLLWLDTLVKMHAVGLDQSLKDSNASQCAIWSRDLAALEMALALIQNVKPLDPDTKQE